MFLISDFNPGIFTTLRINNDDDDNNNKIHRVVSYISLVASGYRMYYFKLKHTVYLLLAKFLVDVDN